MTANSSNIYQLPFLLQDTRYYAELEHTKADSQIVKKAEGFDPSEYGLPAHKIIGVGGAGASVIRRLAAMGLEDATTIAIDTDRQNLDTSQADMHILIGKSLTGGLGACGYPEIGKRAAELARCRLREVFNWADLAFVIASLGGGTGAGAAPIVAEVAKEQGALVIAFAILPLKEDRESIPDLGARIAELQAAADAVILLDSDRLLERMPDAQKSEAASITSQLISETIRLIVDMLMRPSLINVKLSDIWPVIRSRQRGLAVLLVGEGEEKIGYQEMVAAALSHPVCKVDYRKATGVFLIVSAGPDLEFRDCETIVEAITDNFDKQADYLVWNARIRKGFAGKVRVVAILTGTGETEIVE